MTQEYNINGFKIRKARHVLLEHSDEKVLFNLAYIDKQGNEVLGYRRKDVRRIVLEDGRELSHSVAGNELTLVKRISVMKEELSKETIKTGGYSRKWMDAYRALINKRDTLKEIPKELIDEKMEFFIKGYEEACKIFENNATPKGKS